MTFRGRARNVFIRGPTSYLKGLGFMVIYKTVQPYKSIKNSLPFLVMVGSNIMKHWRAYVTPQ